MNLTIGLGMAALRRPAFDPVFPLFGAGEQGALWPWALGTLWKDVARTVPVTTHGDLIAAADDVSGRGNHLFQAVESKRFAWQTDGAYQWALADGLDDFMATGLDLSAHTDVTLFMALEKATTNTGIVIEHTANGNSTPGGFYLAAANATFDASMQVRGATSGQLSSAPTNTAGKRLYTGWGTTADGVAQVLRRNTTQVAAIAGTRGGGPLANSTIYIGARAGTTAPFGGRLGPLIVRGGFTSADLVAQTEAWINARAGVY